MQTSSWGAGLVGIAVACTAIPTTAATDGGRTVQCWTDERGVRACGDHVPPQYAKGRREIVDSHGIVVKVLPREKTAEEQAEEQRKQQEAEQAETAARRQHAYDGFLLQSYQSVAEIEKVRGERLATIDGRLALAEKSQASTLATLDELDQRAAGLQKDGKPVPDDLAKSIRSFRKARTDNADALTRLKEERAQTDAQFARDIERYRSLRGLPSP